MRISESPVKQVPYETQREPEDATPPFRQRPAGVPHAIRTSSAPVPHQCRTGATAVPPARNPQCFSQE
jgi:hypothetical protein